MTKMNGSPCYGMPPLQNRLLIKISCLYFFCFRSLVQPMFIFILLQFLQINLTERLSIAKSSRSLLVTKGLKGRHLPPAINHKGYIKCESQNQNDFSRSLSLSARLMNDCRIVLP
jgi:hypothetical protein